MPNTEDSAGQEPKDAKSGSPSKRSRGDGQRLQQLLRADIIAGRIPAGSRLKVSDLITKYGTSTNPAREALHALEGEGLVVLTPNRGARVRTIDDSFVDSVFDIRRLIEPYLVRWFAEHATLEDRQRLRDIQTECHKAAEAGDITLFHKYNREFHDFIISHHFNQEAARIMRTQNGWLRLLTSAYPPSPTQIKKASEEHWQLIDALDNDVDLACDIVVAHSERSQRVLMGQIRRNRVTG